jgi:hypothetical protein
MLIISSDANYVVRRRNTTIVNTPLDAIRCLEANERSMVVLEGTYAGNDELADALREIYPSAEVDRGA